jgi:hypothetical protein
MEIPKVEFVAAKDTISAHFIVVESCEQKFIKHLEDNNIIVQPAEHHHTLSGIEYFSLDSDVSSEVAEKVISTFKA